MQDEDKAEISTKAKEIARELFDEFDPSGDGFMSDEELVPLLLKLLRFLGSTVSARSLTSAPPADGEALQVDHERVSKVEWEAKKLLQEFDADGNGPLP